MAPGDRVSWKAKAAQLSQNSNISSLDYQNATRAQWGDRGIIKIVLGFRPTFIAAVVDWTELATLITVEIAKESGQEGAGDQTNCGNELIHFAKIDLLKALSN